MKIQNPNLFLLASLLSSCPDERWLSEIKLLSEGLANERKFALITPTLAMLTASVIESLHSDYIDFFDRQHMANPIYETEYGRNRSVSKASELADLAGFYRAFGLEIGGLPEMPDHFAVELEFYAYLLIKQQLLNGLSDSEGVEILCQARRHFLQDHLGSFAQVICTYENIKNHDFYGPLFQWCAELVAEACSDLGVEPAPLAYFSQEQEPEGFGCAVLNTCPVAQKFESSKKE